MIEVLEILAIAFTVIQGGHWAYKNIKEKWTSKSSTDEAEFDISADVTNATDQSCYSQSGTEVDTDADGPSHGTDEEIFDETPEHFILTPNPGQLLTGNEEAEVQTVELGYVAGQIQSDPALEWTSYEAELGVSEYDSLDDVIEFFAHSNTSDLG